jgi:hypothetical protein
MRDHLTRYASFARAATLPLLLCSSSFAECSLNTVRGAWAWQSHGTAMMNVPGISTPAPVPFASLGIMKIDNQGRYTAYGTISIGGQVQDLGMSGSIQVNPDCTATDTYTVGLFQGADRIVILDNGNEMQMMPTRHPLGPVAGRAYFWRIAWEEPHCTPEMVRGVYLGTAEGTLMIPASGQSQPVPTPFSGISVMTFQRVGAGAGLATASLAGGILDMESPKMSIQVNPDCTATLQWTAVSRQAPGQTLAGTSAYVVLDQGNQLIGLETKDSLGLPVKIENHKRISMLPVASDR